MVNTKSICLSIMVILGFAASLVGCSGTQSTAKDIMHRDLNVGVVDADMVPMPIVLAVSVPVIDSDSAIVEWETGIPSDGHLEYGTNELYGAMTYVATQQTFRHRVQLSGLMPNTTYHFRIVASRHNLEATQFISQDYSFTTAN